MYFGARLALAALLLAGVLFLALPARAAVLVGDAVPATHATDLSGRIVDLQAHAGHVVVLEWASPACPYSLYRYKTGAVQALQKRVRDKGGVWLTVMSDAPGGAGYLTAAAARDFLKIHHSRATALIRDTGSRLAALFAAKVTPYIAIIGADGRLAYAGAFDSNPSAQAPDGKVRAYAHDALADLWAGRAVRVPVSRTYGCMIKYAR